MFASCSAVREGAIAVLQIQVRTGAVQISQGIARRQLRDDWSANSRFGFLIVGSRHRLTLAPRWLRPVLAGAASDPPCITISVEGGILAITW